MRERPDPATLPLQVDGVRRGRLLGWDDWSSTWTGWHAATGRPVRLRLVRASRREDPAARAHLDLPPAPPGLLWPTAHRDGAWPHLRLDVPGPSLVELLPLDDPLDPLLSGQALGAAAAAAGRLEAAALPAPRDLAPLLFFAGDRLEVGWLGPPPATAPAPAALARLAWALEPASPDPLCALVQSWAQAPPPDAASAAALVHRALRDHLAAAAHALRERAARADVRSDQARLHSAILRLQRALPPPRVRGPLDLPDRPGTLVHSDGRRVTLGPDQVLWAPGLGLAPVPARQALRAWHQAGQPVGLAPLMRWLRGQSRLRTAALLVSPSTAR